jgi:3-oxoacyl-[acyl-carrier-protein] synthase-1
MSEAELVISGVGMVSSVGLTMAETCASVRAGINRFTDIEDYIPEMETLDAELPQPMKGCRVPTIGSEDDRISNLLLAALRDLVQNARLARSVMMRAALYVALPPADRAGRTPDRRDASLRRFLGKALGCDPARIRLFPGGHTASAVALSAAAGDEATPAIVAGVDSYHDPETLAWLDESGRLRSLKNPEGFLPGEAAAALLLETRSAAETRAASVLAAVRGTGKARETNAIGGDRPSSGAGLTSAIRTAANGDDPDGVAWVACDLNGERYRHQEWGLCQVKLRPALASSLIVWHPADCLGDVGAASASVLLGLAARALERDYAPAPECIVWTGSDDGERAAVRIVKL